VKTKKTLVLPILVAFIAGIAFAGGFLFASSKYWLNRVQAESAESSSASNESIPLPGLDSNTISDIVEKAGPAVVTIETYVSSPSQSNPFFNDPFFREFFGQFKETPQQQMKQGIGSGFIISDDGYILTNEHVVSGAQEIQVSIVGLDKPVVARIVGEDVELDLAVLKVDVNKKLPTLKLGDSSSVNVGNWVIAIGNPYSLDHTVTVGVISAKGRPITVQGRRYRNLLQTDASINPGNSGGPLLNLQGEVIGINTAVNSQAQGIGFAIPSDTVKSVLDDLMKEGKVKRSWLGVEIQDVNQSIANYYELPNLEGVFVRNVVTGGPADKAGIKQGDIIISWNGKSIKNVDELQEMISKHEPGDRVKLTVWRNIKKISCTVTLGER